MASSCAVCGGGEVETLASEGLVVCNQCGNVSESNLPTDEPEWRMFSVDEETIESSRVGHEDDPLGLVHNLASQVTLSHHRGAAPKGRSSDVEIGLTSREKSILTTKRTIELLCESLQLRRCVADSSLELLSQYLHSNPKVERDNSVLVASLIYTACLMTKTILPIQKLCETSHVEISKIRAHHRDVKLLLGLVIPNPTFRDYINSFGPRLQLEWRVREFSVAVVEESLTHEPDRTARLHSILGAAGLLFAGNLCSRNVTTKQVATVCSVSLPGLRTEYKKLYSLREAIVFAIWTRFKPLIGETIDDLYSCLDHLPA